jgi:surface antigen
MRKILLAGAAVALLLGTANAQPGPGAPPGDPDGYYSQSDHDGYYDRNGRYHRYNGNNGPDRAAPPPPEANYDEDAYQDRCRSGNTAAGTIFGALAGGLIGDAASHGRGGAVIGGAILGGLLGNAVARDMPCEDHPHAFRAYSSGLNGDIGRRYEWRNGRDYGTFTPQREFYRGRTVCRTWTETTYARGRNFTRSGTACRQTDGNWRFDD